MSLPARTSEQGNVIGSVRIYIYKCAVHGAVRVIHRHARERTIERKKNPTYVHTYKYIWQISIEHYL